MGDPGYTALLLALGCLSSEEKETKWVQEWESHLQ